MSVALAPQAPAAAERAGGDDVVYGLLAMGGIEVALPLSALREVVPCPAAFAELPASAPGLLGAMDLRGLVVPVLDLRPRLGVADERTEGQVVVIVAQDDQVLGLLADRIRGISRVPASDLLAVRAAGTSLVFSHTFRHPEDGDVVSVLHPLTLLTLPGVPTVQDTAAVDADPAQRAAGHGAPRRALTLLRCGDHLLAIEVAHVHTTLSEATARPSPLTGTLCQGVTPFMGVDVGVVDPLELLGLGRMPAGPTGAGLVLDLEHGYVVLALSELVDIEQVPADAVLPLPAFSVRRPELLAGIADVEGAGHCLVLDGAALLVDEDLKELAALNTPVEDARPSHVASTPTGAEAVSAANRRYLTYSVGPDVATPLEQVAEIVAFPEAQVATEVGDAVLGVHVHRSSAVPVLCLPTLLGLPRASVTSATCLLLVEVDGEHVGFAVEALRAIEPLVSEHRKAQGATDGAGAPAGLGGALRAAPLASIGEDPRLLPDLDLREIARAAREELGATAA